MRDTPSDASDHLCLIWKESTQNCRRADRQTDGRATCYVDLTGGVTLLSQGYIFLPKSLAKCIFFTKTPTNWHFVAELWSLFFNFLLTGEYFSLNSLKSRQNGLMVWKWSLAKGMFSTKFSLAKGVRSKIEPHTPVKKFSEYY